MWLEGPYKVYDDKTFNCPRCCRVHWEKDWRNHWKKDGVPFEMRCLEKPGCRQRLVIIVHGNIVKVTKLTWYRQFNNISQNSKVQSMSKIKVLSHAKKYEDVDTADKIQLIEELQKLVEQDRLRAIEKAESDLAKLKAGQFPIPESAPKKQETKAEPDPVNDIVHEEPSIEPETTNEEEISDL